MKVLIIKLSALGDVILSTPFIFGIQQQHPGDEIHLLTTPPFAGLFEGWPDLHVTALPRGGLLGYLRMALWMRRQRFDICYELQANQRTGWMLRLSCIPKVVSNRIGYPATHHPASAYRRETHIFDHLNLVLQSGGLQPVPPKPWLPISEAGRQKIDVWLATHALASVPLVLMHAFASARWPSKCWPYFAELAESLEKQGFRVIWIGAGTDAGGNHKLSQRAGIDATGAFSINELVELGRRSRFAVTNDSGPMHVLSCASIPVFSFFGPTSWVQSHALNQKTRVLNHPVACSPCFLPQCPPQRAHACLAGIRVDQVLATLADEGLLASSKPR